MDIDNMDKLESKILDMIRQFSGLKEENKRLKERIEDLESERGEICSKVESLIKKVEEIS